MERDVDLLKLELEAMHELLAASIDRQNTMDGAVAVGLGRIVASYFCSTTLPQTFTKRIGASFSETTMRPNSSPPKPWAPWACSRRRRRRARRRGCRGSGTWCSKERPHRRRR